MAEKSDKLPQQPQFYSKVVALSDKSHADWKIKADDNYEFARKTNAVLVTAVEFPLVASEYPIVFIEQGGDIHPVAILGLKPEQNLFVDDKSSWDAKYIPAYVRRYPFILAGDVGKADSTYTVCIDENFSGFNRKSGERLFTDKGKHSTFLERAIAFLKDFQSQGTATSQFCSHLKKLGLLEPMQANIAASVHGEEFSVAGFMVVSRDRLKAKKPVELAELVKTDEMGLIYHHLSSLSHFKNLTDRYASQQVAKAS